MKRFSQWILAVGALALLAAVWAPDEVLAMRLCLTGFFLALGACGVLVFLGDKARP